MLAVAVGIIGWSIGMPARGHETPVHVDARRVRRPLSAEAVSMAALSYVGLLGEGGHDEDGVRHVRTPPVGVHSVMG